MQYCKTGNPCADWKFYRPYVIGSLPLLKNLDGTKVTHSERIEAKQEFVSMHDELIHELEAEGIDISQAMIYDDAMDELSEDEQEDQDDEGKGGWTIKQRLKDHRQDLKKRLEDEERTKQERDRLLNNAQNTTVCK